MSRSSSQSPSIEAGLSKHNASDATDESTPLLYEGTVSSSDPNPGSASPTPLPKAQFGALLAIRLVDPIAYQQIFPYINQFLADLQVAKPDQVGFYSGLVESVYSLAQVLSVYQLGKISGLQTGIISPMSTNAGDQDVVGRLPVVLTGFIGTAMATMAFGLSTSFASIVLSRFLAGLVAGNIAVMHSILAEITDETNQELAVPIYGLSWPLGTVIGPLIGGTLENAATRYPQYFGWRIFLEHPYLPPCIITALYALVGAGLGYLLIGETLPSKRKCAHNGAQGSILRTNLSSAPGEGEYISVTTLWSIPAIRALTISGFMLNYLGLAFDVIFLLVCYAPVHSGGLGLEPSVIGNMFAIAGTVTVLIRAFVMPYILRRFDYAKAYNVCMYIWPVLFGLLPLLNIFARAHLPFGPGPGVVSMSTRFGSDSTYAILLTGLLVLLALSKISSIPLSLSMLLIKRHAPSTSALGQSNGLVQFAMCAGRAVAPVTASTLFTGVNGLEWARQWGIGWIWAVVMVAIGIWGAKVTKGIERDST